jgi:FSR family fosmidomycin resistance protein-like MFS transporter
MLPYNRVFNISGRSEMRILGTLDNFSPDEKRVLLITCPAHFFCHFFVLVFPAVTMPMMATLGMPIEDVVKLSFLMYLCFGMFALPVGLIVDHWQAKGMLVIGMILMGIGMIVAGLFPRPNVMVFALGIVGIGASVYHPAGLALISRTIRQRGYALGFNGVFGNLGIASAPLVAGIFTWLFSWQTTFVILGGVAMVSGLWFLTVRVNEDIVGSTRAHGADGGELVKYYLILCVALVFAGIAYRGNMLLLPAYFELKATFFHDLVSSLSFLQTQGTATLAATVLTSMVLLTGIFGQMFGGKLADRMDLRRAYLFVHASSLPFILAMAFATDYTLAICAAAYVFFSLGMQPIENSLIAALTPARWRSTSYAVKFILSFGIGSSAVYLIGPIKQAFSLETVYVFLAGATTLLVAAIVVLMASSRRLETVRN